MLAATTMCHILNREIPLFKIHYIYNFGKYSVFINNFQCSQQCQESITSTHIIKSNYSILSMSLQRVVDY